MLAPHSSNTPQEVPVEFGAQSGGRSQVEPTSFYAFGWGEQRRSPVGFVDGVLQGHGAGDGGGDVRSNEQGERA